MMTTTNTNTIEEDMVNLHMKKDEVLLQFLDTLSEEEKAILGRRLLKERKAEGSNKKEKKTKKEKSFSKSPKKTSTTPSTNELIDLINPYHSLSGNYSALCLTNSQRNASFEGQLKQKVQSPPLSPPSTPSPAGSKNIISNLFSKEKDWVISTLFASINKTPSSTKDLHRSESSLLDSNKDEMLDIVGGFRGQLHM